MKKLFLLVALTLLSVTAVTRADNSRPPFDFANGFYRANGIQPEAIVNRRTGSDGLSVPDVAPDFTRRNVRVTITLSAYGDSGDIRFWNVFGEFNVNAFIPNAAGRNARTIAERSPIFVFPKRGGDRLALGNNRQSDMIDLRHGYFSNNPLGLWIIVFVNYTDRALNTTAGRAEVSRLASRNGRDLDGTAIIRTVSELDDFVGKGLVTRETRPLNGSRGEVYSICPVIEDPRGGAIARDAFLVAPLRQDGTPLEPEFLQNFESLRLTGDWAR
jgi:hypothetical protein